MDKVCAVESDKVIFDLDSHEQAVLAPCAIQCHTSFQASVELTSPYTGTVAKVHFQVGVLILTPIKGRLHL
eukprot:3006160-Amphidinium_carterae.2